MSLSKQQKFKPGSKERRILDSFGSILPRDAESRIYQLKSNGVVITVTVIVEGIVGLMLYENQKGRFRIHETTSIANLLELFKPHERECFFNVICRLALVQTQGHILNHLELSNQLLQKGYGCLGDVNLFGLIDERTEHQPLEYSDPAATNSFTFVHIHVQHFLAAINLLKIPLMEIFHFLKNHTLAEHDPDVAKNSSTVLRFFFGLAGTVFGEGSTALLQNVLKYLTQYINRDAPVIDSKVSVLILNCLYEAQNTSLYRQVQNETFTRQIFSFDIKVIEDNLEPFAHYLFNTSEPRLPTWTIYCSNKQKNIVNALVKKVTEMKGPAVNMKTNTKLTATDNRRVIISNKNSDYLISVLSDIGLDSSSESSITSQNRKDSVLSETSLSSSDTVSPDRRSSLDQQVIERSSIRSDTAMLSAASISMDMMYLHSDIDTDSVTAPYGYLTKDDFQNDRKIQTSFYYNMVQDFVAPKLQMHCTTLVRTQYRKNDHMWFSFPQTMRHNFYESVLTTPMIAMHWVKVPQPDGTPELEEKFKEKAHNSQISLPPISNEVAELVVLNSHRLERIAVTPPSGGVPAYIPFYRNSELSDNGEIGCDYLMTDNQVKDEIKWRNMTTFDISCDQQIGRELPLPSKKGTESAEITTSTAKANVKDGTAAQTQITTRPGTRETSIGTTKLFTRPLADINVSEQQIKRNAMEGFDRPGYCFYGDNDLFQMGFDYSLPDQLPHTKTLREGGNGTVLEVFYEGTYYAVKRTAFRWREILIMPKLKHKNILRLIAMIMGPAMSDYPRRRSVFQYYPRMTNDLGRSIGSYERYCLRTLKERYRNETLLLSRIIDNFKYVAREMLEALNYLHTLPAPIVHRDIKPSNVLVKQDCSCYNPLVCVCRVRPSIVISDFDASLELSPEGDLIPDTTHSRSESYYTTQERLYHISPVGTIGFKSPEGFMHIVSNSLETLPYLSTKADIFSFGLFMMLLLLNEDGPRYLSQVGTLLLSVNQSVNEQGKLSRSKINLLRRNKIEPRENHIRVQETDIHRILPIKKLRKDFGEMSDLVTFIESSLIVNPKGRPSARDLLQHDYLAKLL